MDTRLLHYFTTVIDCGGVTRAARELFLSQPALSQAIRSLERELSAELFSFDRRERTLSLTPVGRALEPVARQILASAQHARTQVAEVEDCRRGVLRIAAHADIGAHSLPEVVGRFRRRHPRVQVRISDPGSSADVVAAVRAADAEMGLAIMPCEVPAALSCRHLSSEPMVLALSEGLAAAAGVPAGIGPSVSTDGDSAVPFDCRLPIVARSVLRKLPLVREPGDGLQKLLDDEALDSGIWCSDRRFTWELVMAGVGAAVLPASAATSHLTGVRHLRFEPSVDLDIGLVTRRSALSPAGAAFVAMLDEFVVGTGDLDESRSGG